jgi:predicted ATPase/class 3 adenylate cyclase
MMGSVRRDLPAGTVTFLFTDVEGSTRLLHELGAERYAAALAEHRRVVREAFAAGGGVEVDTQGDAFFVAFPTAPGALQAVREILAGLAGGPIRLRMGVHTGTPFVAEEGYVGVDVNRAARIAAVGHGGQVLVSSATAALVGTDGLRDLGEHRLKDLSAPERIYQLGDGSFPPLASLHRTNLPVPATQFVGREDELADVAALLARDDVRLLTLTGPGGTGKTRLALQAVADASERFPHGVFWVPLAPLRDPGLVLDAASAALGADADLAGHVADKRLLLLLDNFEHLVDAAPSLSELLTSCPNLQLVVTSRELLRLPGEQAYPVPTLEPSDGETLFRARARAVNPAFPAGDGAVSELCARLDNLPLAIELAAARTRVLTPVQLLERLGGRLDLLRAGRGADPRQQTLRATIEWSHDLLDPDEQRLFARLAVFAGGCTLEAAEAVCEADLETLESLVDKSLVRTRDDGRFWMLETIRELARERLAASGEENVLRARHAEHFLAFAERADPEIRAASRDWRDRLEREHDNLRAALDRFESVGENEAALRLAAALGAFWERSGHWPEARRRLEALLRATTAPTRARGRALNEAASLVVRAGDAEGGRLLAEEGLALHRALGEPAGVAESLANVGYAVAEQGDFDRARELFAESVELFRQVGDEHAVLWTTRSLAWSTVEIGDLAKARAIHEENLGRARALGNKEVEGTVLGALAMLALDEGRVEDALALLRENMPIVARLGGVPDTAVNLGRVAAALVDAGRDEAAVRLVACAAAVFDEIGGAVPWVTQMNEETVATARSRLDADTFEAAWQHGRELRPDEGVELAMSALGA